MSKDTDKSFFILSPLTAEYAGLYQHLLSGIASYRELGNRIIRDIKAAHAFRQAERVRELSRILVNIPIKEYRLIGQYYLAWCQCKESKYDTATLEKIVEQTRTYKAKALITMAAFEVYKGNLEHALYFYTEALRTNPTISDYIKASNGIATVKSMEGYHASALKELERLLPMLRHAEPLSYFEVINSYSVELGEVGRKSEARNISRLVLASPFDHAYPEWRETADELKEPSRSFVAVPSIEPAPIEIETAVEYHASAPEQPARVVSFPALKEAPQQQKPDRLSPQELAELTPGDMRELLLTAIKTGAIEESEYVKMMGMAGLLKIGPADKIIDLENDEILDDIAIMWSRNIGAEEFVGFLSALRDCDDDIRRTDILDRLITKIFHETKECGLTEEEW